MRRWTRKCSCGILSLRKALALPSLPCFHHPWWCPAAKGYRAAWCLPVTSEYWRLDPRDSRNSGMDRLRTLLQARSPVHCLACLSASTFSFLFASFRCGERLSFPCPPHSLYSSAQGCKGVCYGVPEEQKSANLTPQKCSQQWSDVLHIY